MRRPLTPSSERKTRAIIVRFGESRPMDVVLTPVGTDGNEWSLTDRLRRPLGTVKKAEEFTIVPTQDSSLWRISPKHPTLDAVMTAIAQHAHGACSLDSQERG